LAPSKATPHSSVNGVTSAESIAYEDLGTEEIRRLEVVDFLAVVNDMYGHDFLRRRLASMTTHRGTTGLALSAPLVDVEQKCRPTVLGARGSSREC
jgi:hypothetical protein